MSASTGRWAAEPGSPRGRFEGADHGGPVSGFVVASAEGRGATPHTHPYPETFVVLEGGARFVVDGEAIDAVAGDLVVVPAETVHGFTAGPDGVRLVGIHAGERIRQTDL